MKQLYQKLEGFWTKYLLGPDWSPFVAIAGWLASDCPYCLFWRGALVGAGILAMVLGHFLLGMVLVAIAAGLALAESRYG